jgi:gamma-glutamyltranspeptidase/glutathione hydrolase
MSTDGPRFGDSRGESVIPHETLPISVYPRPSAVLFSRLGLRFRRAAAGLALLAAWLAPVRSQGPPLPVYDGDAIHHPAVGRQGMVVSQDAHATRVGHEVLLAGGNAFDAAVAVGFALAVTLPQAGNLGGGGFFLAHLAEPDQTVAYDFREVAPALVTPDLFLDASGAPSPEKTPATWLGVGVPGSVAGLLEVLNAHGTWPCERTIAPAVRLARDGFEVGEDLAASLAYYQGLLCEDDAAAAAVPLGEDGRAPLPGERLVQADLATTLERVAESGRDGFYRGPTAEAIVAAMEANGGLVRHGDLQGYRVVVREPLEVTYRGFQVRTMPPPSAGGVIVAQVLNGLESFDLAAMGAGSAAAVHTLAELEKRAFADRGAYLGDPGFVEAAWEEIVSKPYAAARAATIDPERATPADTVAAGALREEGRETTHFSVVDRWGNAAACTYTLNHSYGCRKMAPGTGVLLNNELDDFVAAPGVADSFGMVAGDKNLPAPGKRPLSSMCTTVVLRNGAVTLVTGSPGGSHIPSAVLQVITNVIDFGMNAAEATATPRAHHQWQPDELRLERGFSPDTIAKLRAAGHRVTVRSAIGSTQTVHVVDSIAYGAADPRRRGALALGVDDP